MAHVEVLLREHVQDLGKCGDVVRVRSGYARNYLMPKRIAVVATDENKKSMMRRRARLDIEDIARSAEIAEKVALFSGVELVKVMKSDEHGHLYGSVKAAAVVVLLAEAGHEFAEKSVRIDTPIRTVGQHVIRLHIHGDHYAEVTVKVEPEETVETPS